MNIIGVEHSLVYRIMRELKQMGFDVTPIEDEGENNNNSKDGKKPD